MFPMRLKELRNEKGLTQIKFAEAFNISSGTIAMWETGKRAPDLDTIQRLSDFFEVTVDYLLGKSDVRNPEIAKPTDDDIKFALFGGRVTDEAYEDVKKFAQFIKEKYGDTPKGR